MFGPSPLPRTLEAALRDLEHAQSAVRQSALRDLARLADSDERDAVIEALERVLAKDADAGLRAASAVLLADAGAQDSHPALLRALEDPALTVQQNALLALGELTPATSGTLTRDVWQVLFAKRESRLPELRFQALIALGASRHPECVSVFFDALDDRDARVRYIGLRLIDEYLAAKTGAPALSDVQCTRLSALLGDSDTQVRVAAALILAPLGSQAAQAGLVQALNSRLQLDEPADMQALVELAGELGLTQAAPGLRRVAAGRWGFGGPFEFQAKVALARLGDEKVLGEIASALRSFRREKRRLAVVMVGEARLSQFLPELRLLESRRTVDTGVLESALERLAAPESA